MATYNRHDVVRVPFPFIDREATRNRPALVLSDRASFNAAARHSVMTMITSAEHPRWPLDVPINNLTAAGLPASSLVAARRTLNTDRFSTDLVEGGSRYT
jgi:mRNA-degrading endonuclease toxin of MazEF toxin-antitoxin module